MTPATGYALRDENRAFVDDDAWTAVEIDFARANHPLRVESYLAGTQFEYISVHALELSVASPDSPDPRFLDALVQIAEENGASAISDHLGFTHGVAGGPAVGHVTSPPYTADSLAATCRNIDAIQRHFGRFAFYVENLAHFFLFRSTMDETDFYRRLLTETNCGLLLDVTNAYANEKNFGLSARRFIEEVVPYAPRLQMHLAGGYFDDRFGRYIDSHSEPVPTEVWELYRLALQLGEGKVDAVFIERDWNFPSEPGWRNEVHKARCIASELGDGACAT